VGLKPVRKPRAKKVAPVERDFEKEFNSIDGWYDPDRARNKVLGAYAETRKDWEPEVLRIGRNWATTGTRLPERFTYYTGYLENQNKVFKERRLALETVKAKYTDDYEPTGDDFVEWLAKKYGGLENTGLVPLTKLAPSSSYLCSCCGIQANTTRSREKNLAFWEGTLTRNNPSNYEGYESVCIEDPENKLHLNVYWKDQ
jgi:hypothetical protein